ncbi:MAG: hypothetical protein DCF32_21950, partial [Leptolyngbya sp.]
HLPHLSHLLHPSIRCIQQPHLHQISYLIKSYYNSLPRAGRYSSESSDVDLMGNHDNDAPVGLAAEIVLNLGRWVEPLAIAKQTDRDHILTLLTSPEQREPITTGIGL